MDIIVILSGISFCVFGMIDILGYTFHLRKKYRVNKRVLQSRKKVGILSIIIGISGVLYNYYKNLIFADVCLVVFILQTVYVWYVTIQADKEIKAGGS